jgi:hypothetical protein
MATMRSWQGLEPYHYFHITTHLDIDSTGIRSDLACRYIVVNDWEMGVTAPQNVVVVSIPAGARPISSTRRKTWDSCLYTR